MAACKSNPEPELYPRSLLRQIEQSEQNVSNSHHFQNAIPGCAQQYTTFTLASGSGTQPLINLDDSDQMTISDEEEDKPFVPYINTYEPTRPENTDLSDIMSKPFVPSNDPEDNYVQSLAAPGRSARYKNKTSVKIVNNDIDYSDPGNPPTATSSQTRKKKFKLDKIADSEYALPPLHRGFRPRPNQMFLFNYQFDFRSGKTPDPFPDSKKSIDYWDDNHVKLPNSIRNQRKVPTGFFTKSAYSMIPTWKIIKKKLKGKFSSFKELDEAIKMYNNYHNFHFDVLREFIEKSTMPNVLEIINQMAKLALTLPDIVTQSPHLLKKKRNMTLFITQKQIACLLANAFFCTFPRRSKMNDEYKEYPLFNFVSLFSSKNDPNERKIKIEKLKCIFNYFQRIQKERPNGIVTFERRCLDKSPDWATSNKALRKLQIEESGTIEREGREYSEIEFANKFIGGGVLKSGTLQEEIRLLVSPELIVSRLFTEELLDNEALIVNGTVQYNILQGYGNSFQWIGDMRDHPNKDIWNRHYTQIIAIDAKQFEQGDQHKQFEKRFIDRALNKAFCGFRTDTKYKNNKNPAIASGKWGSGAFNGDPYLSCLIQYIAASYADRDLMLFLKNDRELADKLVYINTFCYENRLKIKDLYRIMISYQSVKDNTNIIDFICKKSFD